MQNDNYQKTVIQATTVPNCPSMTSMAPNEPAREPLKIELPNEGIPTMPQVESITQDNNHQKTFIQPINPEDLLIFKIGKAREELRAQKSVSEGLFGTHPAPDQILIDEKQKGKPSMFRSFLDRIKLINEDFV
jgi:hypothetical protein